MSEESGRSQEFTSGYEAYERREEGRRDLASEYLQVGTSRSKTGVPWDLKPYNKPLMRRPSGPL